MFRLREDEYAGLTQLVECQLPKLKVAGSNPVSRSKHGSFSPNPGQSSARFDHFLTSVPSTIDDPQQATLPRRLVGSPARCSAPWSPDHLHAPALLPPRGSTPPPTRLAWRGFRAVREGIPSRSAASGIRCVQARAQESDR